MQELKVYAGNRAPVKSSGTATGQRIECRITTRRGTLHLAGTLAEVLGWMQGQCPGGKMIELTEVRA